jgi:succinate dehydrogenase hydrophobic anchor subunit
MAVVTSNRMLGMEVIEMTWDWLIAYVSTLLLVVCVIAILAIAERGRRNDRVQKRAKRLDQGQPVEGIDRQEPVGRAA